MSVSPTTMRLNSATIDVMASVDCFNPNIEISAEDFRPYYKKDSERKVLSFCISNPDHSASLKENIKHYTSKRTLGFIIDYLKTYLHK